MELCIHYTALPEGLDRERFHMEVAELLDEDGWLTGDGEESGRRWLEMELEDERANPKHSIMAVRSYLINAAFPKDTTLEMSGMESEIY